MLVSPTLVQINHTVSLLHNLLCRRLLGLSLIPCVEGVCDEPKECLCRRLMFALTVIISTPTMDDYKLDKTATATDHFHLRIQTKLKSLTLLFQSAVFWSCTFMSDFSVSPKPKKITKKCYIAK